MYPPALLDIEKLMEPTITHDKRKGPLDLWTSGIAAARFLPQCISVTKNDMKTSLVELKAK